MRTVLGLGALGALVFLGGCDLAWGLSDSDLPACELGRFEGAGEPVIAGTLVTRAVATDRGEVVVAEREGQQYEIAGGVERELQLNFPAPATSIALFPEGDRLFISYALEEPELMLAARSSTGTWQFTNGPVGAIAGTPAEAKFHSRVIVRLNLNDDRFQEYEEAVGAWVAVGAPFELPALTAPNLSANGLTLVFQHADGSGVYAQQRPTIDQPFRDAQLIFAGTGQSAELSADCTELTVVQRTETAPEGEALRFTR